MTVKDFVILFLVIWLITAFICLAIQARKMYIVPEGYGVMLMKTDKRWSAFKAEGTVESGDGYIYEDVKILFMYTPTDKSIKETK